MSVDWGIPARGLKPGSHPVDHGETEESRMTKTDPEQTAQRIAALEAALAERDARIESLESRSSSTEAHRA